MSEEHKEYHGHDEQLLTEAKLLADAHAIHRTGVLHALSKLDPAEIERHEFTYKDVFVHAFMHGVDALKELLEGINGKG